MDSTKEKTNNCEAIATGIQRDRWDFPFEFSYLRGNASGYVKKKKKKGK